MVDSHCRTADAYITIEGESYDSILKGDGDIDNDGRILDVEHSYYRLDRFTIDGKHDDRNYVDKCLYVQQNRDNEDLAPEIEFNGHSFRCVLRKCSKRRSGCRIRTLVYPGIKYDCFGHARVCSRVYPEYTP